MADNKDLRKSYKPSMSAGQSIESLISAPLTAISKANCVMLSGQSRFLLDFCFSKINNEQNIIYKPVLIDMELSDRYGNTIIFQIPLLSLIPINNLAVNKAKIDFNMDIISSSSHKGKKDSQADSNVIVNKTYLGARISNIKDYSNSYNTKSNMSVSLEARQIPLSRGLTTLLDLYTKNINPINKTEE